MTWRYQPDLPPDTPETWRVCDGFHPDRNGIYRTGFMAAQYSDYGSGSPYVAGKAYRTAGGTLGAIISKSGNTVPGSSGDWLVYNGSTWNSRLSAGTSSVYCPQQIAQFGNITLLGNGGQLYARDATTTNNFASVAGLASGACILLVTPLNIVVSLDAQVPGGVIGGASDGWYASDAGDYTNWSTGQAASGNLRQIPGALMGGVVLGNDVIAFKRHGIFRGQYVGLSNLKWKWDVVDTTLGSFGPGSSISVGGKVYFYGEDGFFVFDGSNFQRLDGGIDSTLASGIIDPSYGYNANNRLAIQLVYDSINRRICFFNFGYVDSTSTGFNTCLRPSFFTYNIDSGAWGYQSRVKDETNDSDLFSGLIANGEEFNSLTNGVWTYNSNIALISYTNTDVRMLTTEFASGNCGTNYKPKMRTFRYGDRKAFGHGIRFVPGWTTSSGAGTDLSGATVKTGQVYGSSSLMLAESSAVAAANLSGDGYWIDYTASRRFQSVELQINCEACIDGGEFVGSAAGKN